MPDAGAVFLIVYVVVTEAPPITVFVVFGVVMVTRPDLQVGFGGGCR